ncbi:MAG: radical SAM protein [Bacilli bacterium]
MTKFKKIYVEITNICNKNCLFCSKDKLPRKEMTIKEFEHILKEIKPYTKYIYLHIKGEPLLHKQFNEILDLCTKNNMLVNITTNGTYLSQYKKIIETNSNIRQINISFQSYNEDKDNLEEIIDAANFINKNEKISIVYRFWALNNGILSKDNLKIIDYIIKKDKLNQVIQNQINTDKNIKIKDRVYINKHNLFQWPNEATKINEEGFCYGLKTHLGILSNGTVVPCCLDSSGIINLGNIFKESFTDILKKERTINIINSFKKNLCAEELCKKCQYRLTLKKML